MSAALHKGAQILCPYCDHEYRPADYSAKGMQQALMLHVRDCPTHPISQLLELLKAARDLVLRQFSSLRERKNFSPFEPTGGETRQWLKDADAAIAAVEPKSKKTAQPRSGGQKLTQRVSAGLAANNDSSPSGAAQEAACNAASGVKRSDKNK